MDRTKYIKMRTIQSIELSGNHPEPFQSIKKIIESEGAVILRNLITKEDAAALKAALIQALDEDIAKYGESYLFKGMVHALMNRGQDFIKLVANPVIQNLFKPILGHGCIIHAYNSSSMPPGLTNYSRSIHVDCPRLIPGYITNMGLTIALDAFTADNGAMEIAPHLFNLPDAPDEDLFNAEKVVLDNLEIGDAILFNARCWHRGGVNNTDKWRHAVTMNICRSYMRQQFDYPALLQDKDSILSESAKQFLGYFVRIPKNMDEFLLPPDKRLYRPGQE
jgi:ectoine hydroxylase-related dioxygenase (phytanoyl-CoA dioxygenase family)